MHSLTLYGGCNYLSMLGIKVTRVSKRGSKAQVWFLKLTDTKEADISNTFEPFSNVICLKFYWSKNQRQSHNCVVIYLADRTLCCWESWLISEWLLNYRHEYRRFVIFWVLTLRPLMEYLVDLESNKSRAWYRLDWAAILTNKTDTPILRWIIMTAENDRVFVS